jgi:Leucine-rich repeat (LRR) protein
MLSCQNNLLSGLPALPESLTHLSVNNNKIEPAFTFPVNLKELHCILNGGWPLDVDLPASLTHMSINFFMHPQPSPFAQLRLPAALRCLYVRYSHMRDVPLALPDTLRDLSLITCSLETLPSLPPRLRSLDVSRNRLSSLPPLPPTLQELICTRNIITELPQLPAGLTRLDTAGYVRHRGHWRLGLGQPSMQSG